MVLIEIIKKTDHTVIMEIVISKIVHDEKIIVYFDTDYGSAYGVWVSGTPKVGYTYTVEFDIPKCLTWGNDIEMVESTSPSISYDSSGISIIGELEATDDNGCIFLRLGGNLMILQVNDTGTPNSEYAICKTSILLIYDVNYG